MRDDEALQLLNRIVERLLDGWIAELEQNRWRLLRPGNRGMPRYERMSDGEAAIIRQHQEKTP